MYKIHLNLGELTLSLLFFMGFDNKFKINLFFWRLWDNAAIFLSLLSLLQIGVYSLMEKQYMAKFTLVFYVFLVFGNMIATFLISCRIALLLERILQCLTVFYLAGFS